MTGLTSVNACAACGAVNRVGAKFCDQCGGRLEAPAPSGERVPAVRGYTPRHLVDKVLKTRAALQGERKRVTVLFADIKGSTTIAQEAGPENWHLILEGFFEILTRAVHRYEGTVNQYTGDGIMALFGAPIAHEDHAQRACLAALAMQREMELYQRDVQQRYGVLAQMRIGLNSGEVVVGRIGDDLRMDYTAQGLTVNLAQRMESLCQPGHATLSRATAALVEAQFRLRGLGEQRVAGVAEPVAVFELEGERTASPDAGARTVWDRTRFIGRQPEFGALQRALARIEAGGRGELVLLGGGAGVGKTRLCREFGKRCQAAGVALHRSACLPYARAVPLWPIRRLLRQKLGLVEGQAPADARRVAEVALAGLNHPNAATLRERWLEFLDAGDESQAVQTQGLGLRRRLLEMVSAALLPGDEPQVILIEDLHWADGSTEEFLQALAVKMPKTRTLLLLNYRTDYDPAPFVPVAAERLNLAEFAGDELEQLVSDWFGTHPSVQEVVRRVRDRTGGNPFFLEEAVRDLEQSGYLSGARGAYELAKPIEQWHIPDTVHALLAARMDRLPPEQKALLQSAAVVGQQFNLSLLSELTGAPLYEVVGGVHRLEAAGFVRQRSHATEDEFSFCHTLMLEVAYQALLETQRRTLHARLAECLEVRYPHNGAPCEAWVRIAHHWERAGQWAKAGVWNLAAVRWALRWDAHALLDQVRHAITNLDRAGEAAEILKQRIVARAQLIRSAVHAQVPPPEVDNAYSEGLDLARRMRDLVSHAELQSSYGVEQLRRGDADAAAALTRQAVQLVQAAAGATEVMPFVSYALYAHNTAGRLEEGAALAAALAGPRWLEEPLDPRNYEARGEHAIALACLGHLPQAQGEIAAVLAYAHNDSNVAGWLHAFAVDYAWYSGEPEPALEHARASLHHAEALNSAHLRACALRAVGIAHCLRGDHALAVPILEEARPLYAGGAAAQVLQGGLLSALAEAYAGAGDPERAASFAEAGIAVAQRARTRILELHAWLALLALPRGGHWEARVPMALTRVEALLASTGAGALLPWWLLAQERWSADPAEARDWRAAARAEFARIGATAHAGRLNQSPNS